ncbi:MAG: SRPBCC family protein [Gemmatimonadota bacterium]|nr:SRPBCC family protein [Gemmatimonadota bacterium]
MKRIILWTLAGIAILIGAVLAVGAALPVEHVATVRAEYPVGPEEVFDVISDVTAQPGWRPSVERVEELPSRGGNPAWREIGSTGPLPMELTESDPPRRMVTAMISEGLPFGGRWIYEVEPAPGGSILTITEEGEVYSPFFRFVSRFIMGHHRTASTYLSDLGARLGGGEVEIVR